MFYLPRVSGDGDERTSGPPLASNGWSVKAMKIQLRNSRKAMPCYGGKFVSDGDFTSIHAYLSTVKGGVMAANIALLSALQIPPGVCEVFVAVRA